MNCRRLLIGFGVIFALIFSVIYFRQSSVVELVILHTNDHHGYCWSNDNKGGLAKQLTVVKQVRKENKNVLLLSAGDINTGYPESDIHQGEPSFVGMRLLGFDAMAIGNHEFDLSLSVLREQEKWADFPFLSANIYYAGKEERAFIPYVIKNVGTLRIALMGLTTEETSSIAKFVEGLEFRDPILETKKLMPELKRQADVIIALTHLGISLEGYSAGETVTDVMLAKENSEIDVIVGGHSHTLLREPIKEGKTFILQAGHYAQHLGELHLKVKRSGMISDAHYKMCDLDENIPEDPEMIAALDPFVQRAKILFDQKVGEVVVDLDGEREHVRSQETNLGNLITDLYREMTKAQVAIQNGGGIRASILKGGVTYRDIQKSFPFNNTIVVLKLRGDELLEVLNRSASLPRPAGGFLHVSGLSFMIEKDRVKDVKVNGRLLVLNRLYSVATNDFVASGGDGYTMLKEKPRIDTGFVIAGALKNYFKTKKRVSSKVEGRVRFK